MGDTNRQAPEVRRRPFLQVVLLALASAVAALWVILPFARSVRQQDLPAAAQPLDWEYRSVTLPAWSKDGYYDSAPALDEIAASGADSVTFVATWYAVDERDSEILRAGRTASDASLVWAFKEAKARGLRVILKPHVDLENGNWRA